MIKQLLCLLYFASITTNVLAEAPTITLFNKSTLDATPQLVSDSPESLNRPQPPLSAEQNLLQAHDNTGILETTMKTTITSALIMQPAYQQEATSEKLILKPHTRFQIRRAVLKYKSANKNHSMMKLEKRRSSVSAI